MDYKCPQCWKSHFSGGSVWECTCAYYEPIWKDWVNINPDKNTRTTTLKCLECGNIWKQQA